jgi:hypothetical protein
VSLRFLKGFIAAGLASTATVLAAGITIHSVDDLKKLGLSLTVSFITAGLLAVEKMLSWQDAPQQ